MEVRAASSPRVPLAETSSEYLTANVYPTLEPALEALLQRAFPADKDEEGLHLRENFKPLAWLVRVWAYMPIFCE
jgi:hypothetical protein